ncbi:alginate lyase 2 [Thelonectria olida]|uniref:Alginate lyase 2 n=1 Tax=Thelonectria olida TaxID=1576542 RepID=A0A9P8VRJ9_9HYPO|nr:alginate lyase 2 [Thelonectria olida]
MKAISSVGGLLAALSLYYATATVLDPKCAPGGNFDLSKWSLQLPTGSTDHPDTIQSSDLKGCGGFKNNNFFTDPNDGTLVMKVIGGKPQCVSTPNSDHCRTELREINPSKWSPKSAVNRLSGDLVVKKISNKSVVVGQIHVEDTPDSHKPVMELYYGTGGQLDVGVNTCLKCGQKRFPVGKVPVGQRFTYEIRYEKGKLSVSIDGGEFQNLSTFSLNNPNSYFKAGNYNQGNAPTEVHFFGITVKHS